MFLRAIKGKRRSVIYIDPDGNRMIRRGGTWAWRNNNPGNIVSGRKARTLGSIGRAGGFGVFPDLNIGRDALKKVLQTSYPNTTLFRLVGYYAPKEENNVKRYRVRKNFLAQQKRLSMWNGIRNKKLLVTWLRISDGYLPLKP